ncbi:cytochrome P450 [Bradyrhizobium oligotrophicum]|uniref:cytochrome P450 n=1 Tax=Bradyrhizobium oligotrophicum TaxID=44255 RepID=UPI003EBB5FDE
MTPYIPPHVLPPEAASVGLAALRETSRCILRTWPRAMYETDLWEHPAGGIVHVMSPDAVRTVLLDSTDIFVPSTMRRRVLRPIWRDGLAVAEGAGWRWQRKAASPAFSPVRSLAVVPHANRAADDLVAEWRQCAASRIEITRPLARAATMVVLDALFEGIGGTTDRSRIMASCEQLDAGMGRMNYADILRLPGWCRRFLGPTFDKPARTLHRLVAPLLHARLASRTDRISLLADLRCALDPVTGQAMSPALIEDHMVGAIAAGRETTALALAWTLYLIAHHEPTEQRLLREILDVADSGEITSDHLERLTFTRSVLLESMRLFPPAPLLSRDALADTIIAGHRVRKGTVVVVPIYAIHRHKSFWHNPDAFEPERFSAASLGDRDLRFRFLPFGAGPRVCIGMGFALAEATVILARLIRELRIRPGGSVDFAVGAALRPKGGLRLTISPRAVKQTAAGTS